MMMSNDFCHNFWSIPIRCISMSNIVNVNVKNSRDSFSSESLFSKMPVFLVFCIEWVQTVSNIDIMMACLCVFFF